MYEKNFTAVFKCSKFKLIDKCNNCGHLRSEFAAVLATALMDFIDEVLY